MSKVIYPCSVALKKLRKGNKKHIKRTRKKNGKDCYRIGPPIKDQTPYAAILSCADSRVIPENIFSAKAGDLFVVRVAGNISNTSSIASLEYAVKYLHVRVIVVLGHELCGAVDSAIKQAKDRIDFKPNLNSLLSHIVPAINSPAINNLEKATRKNARLSAQQLIAQSEILKLYKKQHGLKVFDGYYHLLGKSRGKVEGIDKWSCNERC